jgi:ATP-binding cassette subfamily C (CFTR/MRP) protein 2
VLHLVFGFFFVFYEQRYYFTLAKEVMRINGTTKSSLANHVAETVAGAATIRAFEEEDRSFEKNLDLIDINASAFFHSLMFTDMFFNGAFNGSSC